MLRLQGLNKNTILYAALATEGLKIKQLAKRAEISPTTIHCVLSGRMNPKQSEKQKIANVLDLRVIVLFSSEKYCRRTELESSIKENFVSIREFATEIRISRTLVSGFVSGRFNPTFSEKQIIAERLGKPVNKFFRKGEGHLI